MLWNATIAPSTAARCGACTRKTSVRRSPCFRIANIRTTADRRLADLTDVLRRHLAGSWGGCAPPANSVLVFNWLIVGTDAHAKNYSLRFLCPRVAGRFLYRCMTCRVRAQPSQAELGDESAIPLVGDSTTRLAPSRLPNSAWTKAEARGNGRRTRSAPARPRVAAATGAARGGTGRRHARSASSTAPRGRRNTGALSSADSDVVPAIPRKVVPAAACRAA